MQKRNIKTVNFSFRFQNLLKTSENLQPLLNSNIYLQFRRKAYETTPLDSVHTKVPVVYILCTLL